MFALRFFNKKSDFENLKLVILLFLFIKVSPLYKIKIGTPLDSSNLPLLAYVISNSLLNSFFIYKL